MRLSSNAAPAHTSRVILDSDLTPVGLSFLICTVSVSTVRLNCKQAPGSHSTEPDAEKSSPQGSRRHHGFREGARAQVGWGGGRPGVPPPGQRVAALCAVTAADKALAASRAAPPLGARHGTGAGLGRPGGAGGAGPPRQLPLLAARRLLLLALPGLRAAAAAAAATVLAPAPSAPAPAPAPLGHTRPGPAPRPRRRACRGPRVPPPPASR